MKTKSLVSLFLLIAVMAAHAQNTNAKPTAVAVTPDLGTIKIQAEQGDVNAQIKIAAAYMEKLYSADALKWYTSAAPKSMEAQYQVGNLLMFGRPGILHDQAVAAKPSEGIGWIYKAAISGHKEARRTMSKALQSGAGCSTNLAEAYAWLSLVADTGDTLGRIESDNLALNISSEDILKGKAIAKEMRAGHWPQLVTQKSPPPDLGLKLNGLTPGGQHPLAIINGKTFGEGETVGVRIKEKTVNIKCLKINADSVSILVEGEDEPRLLQFK